MRKISVLFALLLVSLSLHAGDYQDIALSAGADSTYGYYGDYGVEDSLRINFAFNLGLSSRWETSLGIRTELTPNIIDENTVFLEFSYALLGARSTKSKVSGLGINMLISAGGFYSFRSFSDFNGAGAYISFTPLTLGSPITGRRERFMKTNLGYDFINRNVVVSFSILTFDYYVRGTYRDYI